MEDTSPRDAAIKELKLIIEKYSKLQDTPRAIGGPFNLSPQEMLAEVENNTETGQKIVQAFGDLRKRFPLGD